MENFTTHHLKSPYNYYNLFKKIFQGIILHNHKIIFKEYFGDFAEYCYLILNFITEFSPLFTHKAKKGDILGIFHLLLQKTQTSLRS